MRRRRDERVGDGRRGAGLRGFCGFRGRGGSRSGRRLSDANRLGRGAGRGRVCRTSVLSRISGKRGRRRLNGTRRLGCSRRLSRLGRLNCLGRLSRLGCWGRLGGVGGRSRTSNRRRVERGLSRGGGDLGSWGVWGVLRRRRRWRSLGRLGKRRRLTRGAGKRLRRERRGLRNRLRRRRRDVIAETLSERDRTDVCRRGGKEERARQNNVQFFHFFLRLGDERR